MSKDFDQEFLHLIGVALEQSVSDGVIQEVLNARAQVIRSFLKDFEQLRTVYDFDIPNEILMSWLAELGWSTLEDYDAPPLVEFRPTMPDNPEDSWFDVLGSDNDMKTSLPAAIKKAYFKLKDAQKAKRRAQYEKLKEEFESNKASV